MRRSGFGIAETLLASSIIAMVILGLYGISSSAARGAQAQRERVAATAQAEEALELVRYERERYWRGQVGSAAAGRSADGFWTYLAGLPGAVNTGNQLEWSDMNLSWSGVLPMDGYSRSLQITKDINALSLLTYQDSLARTVPFTADQAAAAGSSLLKVTVTVSWPAAAGGAGEYELSTYLTDWLEGML